MYDTYPTVSRASKYLSRNHTLSACEDEDEDEDEGLEQQAICHGTRIEDRINHGHHS